MQSREHLSAEQVEDHKTQGNEHFNQGEYAEAIRHYRIVLQYNMWCGDVYYNLGLAHARTNQLDEAILNFTHAIKLWSHIAGAYIERGNVYCEKHLYVSAIEDYQAALFLCPNNAALYYKIGVAYEESDVHVSSAFDCYSRAIELNPEYYDAYLRRGIIQFKHVPWLTKFTVFGAIDDYKKAIQISPHQAEPYYRLGVCYERMHDTSTALACYKNAISRDSLHKGACLAIANKLHAERNYSEAKKYYEAYLALKPESFLAKQYLAIVSRLDIIEKMTNEISLNPNPEAYLNRGKAYSSESDSYERAISDYDNAIELRPDYTEAYVARGDLFESNELLLPRAMAEYDHALVYDPRCCKAYLGKAKLLINDADASLLLIAKVIELEPNNGAAYCLRGDVYGKKELHVKSLVSYLKAHYLDPTDDVATEKIKLVFLNNNNNTIFAKKIINHPDKNEKKLVLAEILNSQSASNNFFKQLVVRRQTPEMVDELLQMLRNEYIAITRPNIAVRSAARYISQGQRSDKDESSDAPASAFFGMPDEVAVMIAARVADLIELDERVADDIARKYLCRP